MTIHEPATLLTDCLLAGLAGVLAWRLPVAGPAARWWRRVMVITAVSALIGGGYHGVAPNFPAAVGNAWWIATLLGVCAASAAVEFSLLHELLPAGSQRAWPALIATKLTVFAGAAITHPVFALAIADYGLALLAWAIAALMARRAWRCWMLAGIALSVIAAVIQQMRWDVSAHFNHNDIYHVVQSLALIGFYRAARKFRTPA